jgi:hypothetical protein
MSPKLSVLIRKTSHKVIRVIKSINWDRTYQVLHVPPEKKSHGNCLEHSRTFTIHNVFTIRK